MNHLIEGLDPTGLDCISVSHLLQMIRAAKPATGQGWLIFKSTAPDVVTNPQLARFFWIKTTDDISYVPVDPLELYYYNGTSWQLISLIDGSLLAASSVTLNKLSLTGASPLYIIQVNAAGDTLIWTSVANAVQTDSLVPGKLKAPDAVNSYVLTCIAGSKAFTTFTGFFAAVANNSIPINKLVFGAANTFMRMNPTADGLQWTTVDVADLLAAGYLAGQSIKRNDTNTGWTAFTPSAAFITESSTPAMQALPAGAGVLTFTSGTVGVPKFAVVTFYCETAQSPYAVGDEIDAAATYFSAGDYEVPPGIMRNGTIVKVSFTAGLFGVVPIDGSGSGLALTRTSWKAKVTFYA